MKKRKIFYVLFAFLLMFGLESNVIAKKKFISCDYATLSNMDPDAAVNVGAYFLVGDDVFDYKGSSFTNKTQKQDFKKNGSYACPTLYVNSNNEVVASSDGEVVKLNLFCNTDDFTFYINESQTGFENVVGIGDAKACTSVGWDHVKFRDVFSKGLCQPTISIININENTGACQAVIITDITDEISNEDEKHDIYKPVCGIFKPEEDGGKLLPIIKNLYKIFKIVIPLLVIILTVVEFLKVLFSGEDKTMKDAFKATTTRLILIVVLVFLPVLIEFFVKIAGLSENCLQVFFK